MNEVIRAWSVTQHYNITQQLSAGIRYTLCIVDLTIKEKLFVAISTFASAILLIMQRQSTTCAFVMVCTETVYGILSRT